MADKIKFYLDEHAAKAIERGLRQRGVDVVMVSEIGMRGASDAEHLEKARNEGRVIFTHDPDFLRLAATTPDQAGIVFCPRQASVGAIISGLMLIHQVLEPKEMLGKVEYL